MYQFISYTSRKNLSLTTTVLPTVMWGLVSLHISKRKCTPGIHHILTTLQKLLKSLSILSFKLETQLTWDIL